MNSIKSDDYYVTLKLKIRNKNEGVVCELKKNDRLMKFEAEPKHCSSIVNASECINQCSNINMNAQSSILVHFSKVSGKNFDLIKIGMETMENQPKH